MTAHLLPPVYAAFIWWFSTGAVLLLVGRFGQLVRLRVAVAAGLLVVSLCGLAVTASDSSVGAAYAAFTSTILLWGAQEIAFLTGWLTGPRPLPCPAGVQGSRRLGFALQAILYHELALLTCGAAVLALTWNAANQVGIATFGSLWVLRQSAKINLYLGVPVTNDELMPEAVRFLKTYFMRQPVSAFFPISVSLATAVIVILIQRIVEVAATPVEVVSLMLVSTLFALGVVEHWFMLLPMPALKLWGWGMRPGSPPEEAAMEEGPSVNTIVASSPCGERPLDIEAAPARLDPRFGQPQVVLMTTNPSGEPTQPQSRHDCARKRLEDQFRQRFLDQHPAGEMAKALSIAAEPATVANGRSS
jgi:putative photosynthetic complex assembly protein 2